MSGAAAELVLEADHVSVRYGGAQVVDDVSFSVERGSVFALLGRNGVGKSSLIRCLLGQQRPSTGDVRLFGRNSWRNRAVAMARIGIVPEEPDAPPAMNARELVAMLGDMYPRWDGPAVRARIERAGVSLGLPFGKLSKGQKGAVMLALALGHSPELLILDDPTLGLDAVARKELYDEIIGELADRGTTVLLSSHDLEGIERLADRVAIVKERRLLLNEPLDGLKGRFRRLRVTGSGANGLLWTPFETVMAATRDWGAEALVTNFSDDRFEAFRSRTGTIDVEVASLSLEEIFVALVGRKEGLS